jgi:hypothetical protein
MKNLTRTPRPGVYLTYLIVIAIFAYSWCTKTELYPFAPFQLFSKNYGKNLKKLEIFALFQDGQSLPVERWPLGEGRVRTKIFGYYHEFNPSIAFDKTSLFLRELLNTCQQENCSMISGTEWIDGKKICGLKALIIRPSPSTLRAPSDSQIIGAAPCM